MSWVKGAMSKRISITALIGVAVLVFLTACGAGSPTPTLTPVPPVATPTPTPTATPTPAPPTATPTVSAHDSVQATLLQRQNQWESSGIVDYDYVGAWSCFCPEAYRAATQVTVRSGKVTGVGSADPDIDTIPMPERFLSVEELFALVQDAITENAARIEVSYDETYGYPVELFIDHDERMADEETSFGVTSLTPK